MNVGILTKKEFMLATTKDPSGTSSRYPNRQLDRHQKETKFQLGS